MMTSNTLAKRTAWIAVLLLSSSVWLRAQDTNQVQTGQPEGGQAIQQATSTADLSTTSPSSPLMKINKGSSLIGTTVKNQQGEELGKIRDLVVDFKSGRVAYLVLDSAPGLFTSQKLHAVSMRAFQPDSTGTALILNADKDKLLSSEGFDKNNWPAAATATWGAEPPGKNTQDPQCQQIKDTTIAPLKAEPQAQPQQ